MRNSLAIIPARGGSKRIPRKNIKEFFGKEMIGWSILTAKDSGLFDKVVVSTDDEEIAKVAKSFGAEVPFFRPESLSDDFTPTVPVIAHAIQECIKLNWKFDYVCCIYPCCPFLKEKDLQNGFEIISFIDTDYVYPVTEFSHPIQRAVMMLEDGKLEYFTPEYELSRTQDLEKSFHDTGQFYWGKRDSWLNEVKVHSNAIGLPVPNWRTVDIDNEEDWKRAEILFEVMKANDLKD